MACHILMWYLYYRSNQKRHFWFWREQLLILFKADLSLANNAHIYFHLKRTRDFIYRVSMFENIFIETLTWYAKQYSIRNRQIHQFRFVSIPRSSCWKSKQVLFVANRSSRQNRNSTPCNPLFMLNERMQPQRWSYCNLIRANKTTCFVAIASISASMASEVSSWNLRRSNDLLKIDRKSVV